MVIFSKISSGTSLSGVPKSQTLLRSVDSGSRTLYNAVKFDWETLNLRGYPQPAKVYGVSIEGVEVYKMLKRSQLYLPRNSRYKGSKFDLFGPLAAKP